ncbi:MAG: hypothetical protein NUV65_01005, partial [Candidatus Roizmanbacteria bacterium]|nr:hypothetical protein [Candidatus Roizmanbacteria bacterium]
AAIVDDPGGTPVTQKVTLANLLFYIPHFTCKYATRDLSAVAGDVAYTGAGFTPKMVLIFGNLPNLANRGSFGVYDGTNYATLAFFTATGTNSSTSQIIYTGDDATWNSTAVVASMDSDGVTLTWAKVGSATGIMNMVIVYFR